MSVPVTKPPTLARRIWPAVALASASAAFLSALDNPAGFASEEISLTGAQDSVPATALAPTLPATTVFQTPATAVPVPTSAVVPASGVPANTVPIATVPSPPTTAPPTTVLPTVIVDPNACAAAPINGPSVSTRWGPVQVQAVLRADGTVCEVTALVTPSSKNKSVQINNRAKPILHDRVVAAGGTDFQSVSGATITSSGYRASLQAILDNA
jgi:uncharacterized protein with FMN-binding domain